MNSKDRKENRYWKRVLSRVDKIVSMNKEIGRYEDVFSYSNLFLYGLKSCKNVGWKASTQRFKQVLPTATLDTYNKIISNEYTTCRFNEFDIMERGKPRHIKSVNIKERAIQKLLCDEVLVKLLSPSLIHDNGASLKGKGIHFAHKRLNKHLKEFYINNGFSNKGYVLTLDFSKYFDTAPHWIVEKQLRRKIMDKNIINISMSFIDAFGDIGYGLGSQVSQLSAITVPNYLDHYIKEKLKINGYARYMDDSYLISDSKEYLEHCLEEINKICDSLGIKLNKKKTRIEKLNSGFTFLKNKVRLTRSGKIIKRMSYKSIKAMKRKLKIFLHWNRYGRNVDFGKYTDKGIKEFPLSDIVSSYYSWKAHANIGCNYWSIYRMDKFFIRLFGINIKDKELVRMYVFSPENEIVSL